jgi:hypothetical protein
MSRVVCTQLIFMLNILKLKMYSVQSNTLTLKINEYRAHQVRS